MTNKLKEEQLGKVSGGSSCHYEERNSQYLNEYTRKISTSEANDHIGEIIYFDKFYSYTNQRRYEWILGTLVSIYDVSIGCNGISHRCMINVIDKPSNRQMTAVIGSNYELIIGEWNKFIK